jgi:hypothetical protein
VTFTVYSKSAPSGAASGIAYPLEAPDEPLLDDEPLDEPLLDDEPPLDELLLPSVAASRPGASAPPSVAPGLDEFDEPHAPSATPPSTIATSFRAECMPATLVVIDGSASE